MSAFILNDYHISTLVTWAARRPGTPISVYHKDAPAHVYYEGTENESTSHFFTITREGAQEIGQILLAQNARSVNARYKTEDAPDFVLVTGRIDVGAVQILKACSCYDYQACETDDYQGTYAAAIIESIRSHAIRCLDGYEDAEWELSAEADEARRQAVKAKVAQQFKHHLVTA